MNIFMLENIESVGSRLEKERLLGKLDEDSLRFLRKVLDPMVTFGVTADDAHLFGVYRRQQEKFECTQYWNELYALLEKLEKRQLTGHAAQAEIERVLSRAYRDEALLWSTRILNKNLRIGVQTSTLNNVFPGSVQEWEVALAQPYDPEKHVLRGEYIREPKLDGLRGVYFQGKIYTRNGREIDSVGHILKELQPFVDDYVFDGELMGAGDFDEASGTIRRKGEGANSEIVFNVFDCIDLDGWKKRETFSLAKRKEMLQEVFDGFEFKNVKMVPWVKLPADPTPDVIVDCGDAYIAEGYEGAMIKDLGSPYLFKRSDVILKVKRFHSLDGTIASLYEGRGKAKGSTGGIFVDHGFVVKPGITDEERKVQTKVGSGFDDAQRSQFWSLGDAMIGRAVEIKYQNGTKDGKMRFPIFLRLRPDKD